MKRPTVYLILPLILIPLASLQLGMARQGQYDEEARAIEKQEKEARKAGRKAASPSEAAKRFAEGVKQVTVDSAAGFVSDTADATKSDPMLGTVEGARQGTGTLLDNAVKGTAKIATLGYADVDHYEVEEPEHGTDDTTKIKLKF